MPEWVSLVAAAVAIVIALATWVRSSGKPASSTPLDTLTPGQRWEVAKIVGAVLVGVGALLGLGAGYIVDQSAQKAAADIKASDVAEKLQTIEFAKTVFGATEPLPPGAVLAFYPELQSDDGVKSFRCPTGWILFEEAAGRFLLAAGSGLGLSPRPFGGMGGDEVHALRIDEMPSHSHGSGSLLTGEAKVAFHIPPDIGPNPGGSGGVIMDPKFGVNYEQTHRHPISGETDTRGGGQPHNNMPPYLAIWSCPGFVECHGFGRAGGSWFLS